MRSERTDLTLIMGNERNTDLEVFSDFLTLLNQEYKKKALKEFSPMKRRRMRTKILSDKESLEFRQLDLLTRLNIKKITTNSPIEIVLSVNIEFLDILIGIAMLAGGEVEHDGYKIKIPSIFEGIQKLKNKKAVIKSNEDKNPNRPTTDR